VGRRRRREHRLFTAGTRRGAYLGVPLAVAHCPRRDPRSWGGRPPRVTSPEVTRGTCFWHECGRDERRVEGRRGRAPRRTPHPNRGIALALQSVPPFFQSCQECLRERPVRNRCAVTAEWPGHRQVSHWRALAGVGQARHLRHRLRRGPGSRARRSIQAAMGMGTSDGFGPLMCGLET